jgi:hypothetical protein
MLTLLACVSSTAPPKTPVDTDADTDTDTDADTDTDTDADTDADTDTDTDTDTPVGTPWAPPPGTTWQWQLAGNPDLGLDVDMYDVDLFDTPSATSTRSTPTGRW